MGIEIERKFLVKGDFSSDVKRTERIVQAYLCSSPERTVRVRIKGDQGFLTIKGASDKNGFARSEFEYPIPAGDAEEILRLCPSGRIDKIRHYIDYKGHTFEVDVFSGKHEGLTLAELELSAEDEQYEKPGWLGEEVTGDLRYYNAIMASKE